MRKMCKRTISVILTVLLMCSVATVTTTASAEEEKSYYNMGLVDFDAVLSGSTAKAQNYSKMLSYIAEAEEADDDILVFPEYSLTSTVSDAVDVESDTYVKGIAEQADKDDMYILFGATVEDDGDEYSAIVICDPEGKTDTYYKTHLTDEEYKEGFSVGDDPYVLKTSFGTFGLALGNEFAEVAELGKYYYGYSCNSIIVCQAYSYTTGDEKSLSQAEYDLYTQSYAYTRMYSRYVATANLFATDGDKTYFGESNMITSYSQSESSYPIGGELKSDGVYKPATTKSAGLRTGSVKKNNASNGMSSRRLGQLADWYGKLTDYEKPVYGEGGKYKDNAKVASVNFHPVWGDLDGNVKLIKEIMASANKDGVELLVFPEMALTGYDVVLPSTYDDELKEKYGDDYMQHVLAQTIRGNNPSEYMVEIQELAESYGMYVLIGLPERDEEDPDLYWNSVGIFGPDLMTSYRKVNLASPEPNWAAYGTENDGIFETPFGYVGVAICADIYNYQELQRTYSEMGCRIVINCTAGAASNNCMDGSWQLTYQNRLESFMLRDNSFMITSNLVGYEGPVTKRVTDVLDKYGLTVDDLYTAYCNSSNKELNDIWKEVYSLYAVTSNNRTSARTYIFPGASVCMALDSSTSTGTYVYGNYTESGVQYNKDGSTSVNPYMNLTPDTFNKYYVGDFDLSKATLSNIYNSNPYSYRPDVYYDWYCDLFYMTYGQATNSTITDKASGVEVSGSRLVPEATVTTSAGTEITDTTPYELKDSEIKSIASYKYSIGDVSLTSEYNKRTITDTTGATTETVKGKYTGAYLPFIGDVDIAVPVSDDAIYYLYKVNDGKAEFVASSAITKKYSTDGYTTKSITVPTDSITFTTSEQTGEYVLVTYGTKPTVKAPTTVSLAKTTATVYVKGTATIKATVKNGVGNTTYKSSNTSVATVSATGKVTAKKAGTAKITVTNNKVSKVFTVNVKNPKLNVASKTIKAKKTFTLSVTGKVGTAKFTSSNKKIATVSSRGVVKGVKKGTATITVTTNGMKLKCKVTVK